MPRLYFYLNALLYFVLAMQSTFALQSTSTRRGYQVLSIKGRAEYITMYGGLQLGLVIMFVVFAQDSSSWHLGAIVSMALYAPILIYRVVTALMNRPVPASSMGSMAIEGLLLLAAFGIYRRL